MTKKEKNLKYLEYILLIPSFLLLGVLIIFYSVNALVRIPFLYIQIKSWKRAWYLYVAHLKFLITEIIGI